MKYKPLNMFVEKTDELKKLIAEHPDYSIVVICSSDVVADCEGWYYAPKLRFSIGEILDCEQDINDEKVYIDRIEFEEDIEEKYSDIESDEEYEETVEKKKEEYEPYWKKVIQIQADV